MSSPVRRARSPIRWSCVAEDAQSSLACWNRANPQRPIRVGQVILEVNGLQQGQERRESQSRDPPYHLSS